MLTPFYVAVGCFVAIVLLVILGKVFAGWKIKYYAWMYGLDANNKWDRRFIMEKIKNDGV